MVQWLRLHASNAGGLGLIPGQGTVIQHVVQCGNFFFNKKKKKVGKQSSSSMKELIEYSTLDSLLKKKNLP